MKKTILPVILILSFCILHGCKKGSCDSGSFVLEERRITAIREIILHDNINLVIYQDSTEKLVVDAGEHMQGDIETAVAGNVLTLRNNSSCNWLRDPSEKITVTIYTKDLKQLSYYGSGSVTSGNTLRTDELKIKTYTGAGDIAMDIEANALLVFNYDESPDITVQGYCNYTYAAILSSRCTLDLSRLLTIRLDLDYRSVRDAHVQVSETINAKITYKGNVYYRGGASFIQTSYYDSGRLLPHP